MTPLTALVGTWKQDEADTNALAVITEAQGNLLMAAGLMGGAQAFKKVASELAAALDAQTCGKCEWRRGDGCAILPRKWADDDSCSKFEGKVRTPGDGA